MGPVVPAAAATAAGTAAASAGFSAVIAKFVVNLVISYAIARLTAPDLKKLNRGKLSGVQVMARSALEYTKRAYGTAMVSGPIVYQNLSGGVGQYLWLVVALTDHEIDSVDSIWFDGDQIPVADIDWDPTASPGGTGDVSTAKWIGDNSTGAVNLWYYLGTDSQTAAEQLTGAGNPIATDWTSAHRLRGCSYLIARLLYNADTEKIFNGGPPDNIKALIRGAALYDPRLDSTQQIGTTTGNAAAAWRGAVEPAETGASGNELRLYRGAVEPTTTGGTPVYGSGAHRTSDSTTWAWSDNPALAAADYLVNVMGVAATKIDWASVADAADDCDVLVVYDTSSPENTQKRFTINGAVSMGESHQDNLSAIQDTMDGRIYWTQGKWHMRAGVWKAPAVTITEDELIGDISVRGSSPKRDKYNLVRGFYVDSGRLYEPVEFPHITSATYQTRDNGEVIPLDIKLPLIDNGYEAQRIAYRLLNQSNNQMIMELPVSGIAANLSVGDTVNLDIASLGWTGGSIQTARVIDWKFQPDGTFKLVCKEDYEASYTDPAGSDYIAPGTGQNTELSDVVPAPSGLTATAVPNGIQLDFTPPPAATYDFIQIYEGLSDGWNDSPMPAMIAQMRGNQYFIPHESGTTRYYWVRAIRLPDLESSREPNVDTSTVTATAGTQTQANLMGRALSDVTASPTDAVVGYQLNADTGAEEYFEGVPASPTVWTAIASFLKFGSTSDLQCYMELVSGSTPAGSATNTWLDMSTTRNWTLTMSAVPSPEVADTFTGTISIRNKFTQEQLASATVTMSVQEIGGSEAVSASTGNISLFNEDATAYAGVQFNTSGAEFRNANGGSTAFTYSLGDWLDVGSSSNVWVERTVNSGSLSWQDPGTGRLQLSTTREYGVQRVGVGVNTANVTFDFYDASVGGNLLDSVTRDITATYEKSV